MCSSCGLPLCRQIRLPLCRAQNRQGGVSLFPHRKEIFVSFTTLRRVERERRRASHSQMRERIQRRERRVASVIENTLKLRRRFRASVEFQISQAAQVLWPEFGGGFVAGR